MTSFICWYDGGNDVDGRTILLYTSQELCVPPRFGRDNGGTKWRAIKDLGGIGMMGGAGELAATTTTTGTKIGRLRFSTMTPALEAAMNAASIP